MPIHAKLKHRQMAKGPALLILARTGLIAGTGLSGVISAGRWPARHGGDGGRRVPELLAAVLRFAVCSLLTCS
jgi:hypothetical protein